MFQRLYEFSHILPEKTGWERLNEGMPQNYDRGIAVCFDDQGDWRLQDRQGSAGVVYRSGPPNGTNYTPCCKLVEKTSKTAQRLFKASAKLSQFKNLDEERRSWLQRVAERYREHSEAIWEAIETRKREAGIDGKDHRGYLYLARNSLADPVYAWGEAKDHLVAQFLASFSRKDTQPTRGTGVCSVCGLPELPVYGNFSVIACYNLDKAGSIAGGFDPAEAYRNLPVCADCALALAEAFAFAERHFTSFMAGQNYLVFPYAESEEIQEELAYRLEKDPQRFDLDRAHDLVAQDLAIRREFAAYKDQLAFSLVFFSADQASWRVRAEVQHLLPSRLEALLNATGEIARAEDLRQVTDVRIKRTVRDWFLEQEPDVEKRLTSGREVLIRDTLKPDGHLSEGKDRAEQFLKDVGKDKKGVERRDALHAAVVAGCIDARLFGATLPLGQKAPSLQLTGPVQFSAFNRSLHRVSPQLVQQTAAYAGKAGSDQKSFAERWLLPYALIAAYGVVNENAAATTTMGQGDMDALMAALWYGTAGLNTHSKMGHQPLLLALLQHRPGHRLGALPSRLRLADTAAADTALRSTSDYRLDIGDLLDALAGFAPLEHMAVHQDPRLSCVAGDAKGGFSDLAQGRGLEVSTLEL